MSSPEALEQFTLPSFDEDVESEEPGHPHRKPDVAPPAIPTGEVPEHLAKGKEFETIQYFEGYDASYQESSHGSAFGELDTGEESYSDEEKQMKKARFVFKEKQELKFISGVQNPTWTNNKLTFDYIGPVNELIQWMNQLDLQDAVLEEPDLETIFMNYYQ